MGCTPTWDCVFEDGSPACLNTDCIFEDGSPAYLNTAPEVSMQAAGGERTPMAPVSAGLHMLQY